MASPTATRLDPLEVARRGWHPPEPADPVFVEMVRANLREARFRAMAVLPRERRQYRRTEGRCAGCGCPWDEFTPKCNNCSARRTRREFATLTCSECGFLTYDMRWRAERMLARHRCSVRC